MKVVILAGGLGTRISEESYLKPKPMVEIGGRPMLWHIMKIYSHYGFNDFIICAGYKQEIIKQYFANYELLNSDVCFDFSSGKSTFLKNNIDDKWKVTIIDTGLNTLTGGRLKKIKDYLDGETFAMTYGDGVSDVDLKMVLDVHKKSKKLATLTAVQTEGRFGVIDIASDGNVPNFREKSKEDTGWINGGFMFLEPKVLDYIEGDQTSFEREPLEALANNGCLDAYKHNGFWQCMDTMRDKEKLESMWLSGKAPWKVW